MFHAHLQPDRPERRTVPLLALLVPLLAGPSFALASDGVSGSAAPADESAEGDPEPRHPAGGRTTITPGECETNADGVEVCSTKKKAEMTPARGDEDSATQVVTNTGFEGSVTGIDGNDSVHLASRNDVTISGNGGNVQASGSSTLVVTNGSARGSMTIMLQNGNRVHVPPGTNGLRIDT